MSRRTNRHTGFYDTIEYIGPRPEKPRKKNHFFGGWVIVLLALGIAYLFGKPLIGSLRAEENGTSVENVDKAISRLSASSAFGERLAAAALEQTRVPVAYDDSYYQISYPGGDIPANKGKAEDVIVRAYRSLGLDLQQLVHEDMGKALRPYQEAFQSTGPDTNIDHRRAQNLNRFFERNGEILTTSRNPSDYLPGDIVIITHPGVRSDANSQIKMHIAMIVPGPGDKVKEPWLVHNLDSGTKWENVLLDYQILGHYRFGK